MRAPIFLSLFLTSSLLGSALAANPPRSMTTPGPLAGKRLADQLLQASDVARKAMPAKAIEMAIRRHGLQRAALRADFARAHTTTYTKELPATPIRDQASSGRCWIFATLNALERQQQVGANAQKPIRLSRAWINAKNLQTTAYELIVNGGHATAEQWVSASDVGEGGFAQYAINLVDKYGVVPERVMRDFKDSKASSTTIKLLETEIVAAQERLRGIPKHTPEAVKIILQAQRNVDRIIALAFTGKPTLPEKFVVDGKEYTPKSFAQERFPSAKPSEWVTLDAWQNHRQGWRKFGDGTHKVEFYNTKDVEQMKDAVRAAIDAGHKVYISAPVAEASAPYMVKNFSGKIAATPGVPNAPGVMSIAAHDYASLGVPEWQIPRGLRQRNGLNGANHAMTVTGYDLGPDGKVVKWKVENSWGTDVADKGVQHMYDDFFSMFVGAVTVPKSAIAKPLLDKMMTERQAMYAVDTLKVPK